MKMSEFSPTIPNQPHETYSLSDFQPNTQNIWHSKRRTLALLLSVAAKDLYPDVWFTQEYTVGNGTFFMVHRDTPLLPSDVLALKTRMIELAGEERELLTVHYSKEKLLRKLANQGSKSSHDWIQGLQSETPPVYEWNDRLYVFNGKLCSKSSEAGTWDLIPYPPGIMLHQVPPSDGKLTAYEEQPTLFRAFFDAQHWGAIQGASYISDVNKFQTQNRIERLIQVSEALHERKIAEIADTLIARRPRPKVVLVSGPSSSGKTTFSKRLRIHLRLLGIRPRTVSLDDFYLSRDKVPRLPNGDYDFEALEALDIELFNEVLLRLIGGESVKMPKLDFTTHKRIFGEEMQLSQNGILIIEGIHGLNPRLTPALTAPSVFKVYISALFHLKFDALNRVSTTDLRLLRRMVRDSRARGYPPEETLSRWASVRIGEVKHIYQYQEEADMMFNSALPYELSVLKPFAVELLNGLIGDETHGREAERLLGLLASVRKLPKAFSRQHIPPTSIAREFIGGSVLVS
ncbi:nucleoside kinase [bacterium]|nr:nucleoside kinase [bacterium]